MLTTDQINDLHHLYYVDNEPSTYSTTSARGLQSRYALARTAGVHGFSAWVLGPEDPAISPARYGSRPKGSAGPATTHVDGETRPLTGFPFRFIRFYCQPNGAGKHSWPGRLRTLSGVRTALCRRTPSVERLLAPRLTAAPGQAFPRGRPVVEP